MGLTVRDDPPRVIDPASRKWGDPVDGFALSIEQISEGLSVVLRNVGTSPQTLVIPGWLAFLKVGIDAPLTPFGRELLKPGRERERVTVKLGPGELTETQIPLGSLFVLEEKGTYRTRVSCQLQGGGTVLSNTVALSA
jgi:hypothetical protein